MSIRQLIGDCRAALPTLPAESVHCVVTSPPYFGLRDYGTAKWEGGDAGCDHLMPPNGVRDKGRDRAASGGTFHDSPVPNQIRQQYAGDCPKCGAHRIDSQIGLEPSPDAYIAELVAVFREVRRVLRKDGTLWLNLGDSYASGGRGSYDQNSDNKGTNAVERPKRPNSALGSTGAKPKDLLMIPARVALALQADGWWLRSEIIWAKPNPMPESVTDRPTSSHEKIYLLSKSERYWYDADAVREPVSQTPGAIGRIKNFDITKQIKRAELQDLSTSTLGKRDEDGRNLRNVWTIATAPFAEAHFATFPPALVEPCIKAGCPIGGTVLDPFGGAGTVGLVADRLQRNAILIELNQAYAAMAEKRVWNDAPLLQVQP